MANIFQEWAPVVAALASAASAIAAWRTAAKTSKSAEVATAALAMTLRPVFTVGINHPGDGKEGHIAIRIINTSAHDATTVSVAAYNNNNTNPVSASFQRVRGIQPNVIGSDDEGELLLLRGEIELLPPDDVAKHVIRVVIRYNDDQGIQRWEQEVRRIVERVRRGDNFELVRRIDLGEPRKVKMT